jgi:hypothetical protein
MFKALGVLVAAYVAYDASIPKASAEDWPPSERARFLDLQTLQAVPVEYQAFIGASPPQ